MSVLASLPRPRLAAALTTTFLALGSIAAAASAAPVHAQAAASAPAGGSRSQHAVFVLTDDPDGNGVIAFRRSGDGSLQRTVTYSTHGRGARLPGAVVDPLASQGGLTYDAAHRLLFAVNAGSDTLTVFRVDGARLARTQVIGTRGTLPTSVAVRGRTVYVMNAGGDGSVAGFRVVGDRLAPLPGSVRSLHLGNPAEPNFLKAPAQVAITPDARSLLVTTKTNGTVHVWGLDRAGRPIGRGTVNAIGAVPFAMAFDRSGNVLLVDASGTLTSVRVTRRGALATVSGPVAGHNAAPCWITTAGPYAYVANAGSGTVTGFRVGRRGALTLLDDDGVTATTGPGPIDLDAVGDTLYVTNGGNGSLSTFRIAGDGSLAPLGTVTGLTDDGGTGVEGIVAI